MYNENFGRGEGSNLPLLLRQSIMLTMLERCNVHFILDTHTYSGKNALITIVYHGDSCAMVDGNVQVVQMSPLATHYHAQECSDAKTQAYVYRRPACVIM